MTNIGKSLLFLLVGVYFLSFCPLYGREEININRDWKFWPGNAVGLETINYNDLEWTPVHLPHSFDLPYFMSNYRVGYGCYRKHLNIKPEWLSKCIFVEFEAAFQDAEIYVNGKLAGGHKGGFTGFSIEISSLVHAGDNVLAVRLNNLPNQQIEPIHGDHTFMGGIYRNVYLLITSPLHVTWHGTWVTTPTVSTDSATVQVKTEVINSEKVAKSCTLVTDLINPDGLSVAQMKTTQMIGPGATTNFEQTSPLLTHPKLWHPSHPYLYTALTHLSIDGSEVDETQTPFGLRWFKWTPDQGFFLNGEHLYFHGANVHQDHAGWGDAITSNGARRDVKLVKEAGLDFIRGSHYPHHPAFVEACDQLGILLWSENCFWDKYPEKEEDGPGFEQNALETLREEIRIFRNNPSIVVWSMCNEVFFSSHQDKVKSLLTKLVNESHQLDPTRPAAIGGCQRGGLDKLGDIAGYNGDGASIAEYQNPGIPNVVSEYGSSICDRGQKGDDYTGMFNRLELNENTPEYPWRSGQVLWCAFDYSTLLGHFGHMGFMDYFRIPKRSWYWYRNHFRNIPPPNWPTNGIPSKLLLTADKTTLQNTNGTDDSQILVTVQDKEGQWVSNSPPVTFTITSGPGEFPTGRSITFYPDSNQPQSDIRISDGLAAIEFRSYFGGSTVITASSPGLTSGSLTITTVGDPAFISGQSPTAPDRPYAPQYWIKNKTFACDDQGPLINPDHNLAQNHPVNCSTEQKGFEARLANDGQEKTSWQPVDSTHDAWWQVDLETITTVKWVKLSFAEEANYRYALEVSPDGSHWTRVVDKTNNPLTARNTKDPCLKADQMRFVRLIVLGTTDKHPIILNEIQIFGQGAH